MDFNNFRITKIEIKSFKNLRDFTLVLEAGQNIIYGNERKGKTSVCEFIQFMLYGIENIKIAKSDAENIDGRIEVFSGTESYAIERRISKSECTYSFISLKDNKPVNTQVSAGEFLTGLDFEEFSQFSYFAQPRFGLPEAKLMESSLIKIAQKNKKTAYLNYISLKEKLKTYRNDEKSGILDKIDAEKKILSDKISSEDSINAEISEAENDIENIDIKFDDNEKRIIILKADMSEYRSDRIIDENIKNAQDLKNSIRIKEKNLNILDYELSNKHGKLKRESLDILKSDYNALSATISNQIEVRNTLDIAQDSQSYHSKIYQGKPDYDFYSDIYDKYKSHSRSIVFWIIIGAFLLVSVPALFFAANYHFPEISRTLILAGLCAGLVSSLASFSGAIIFSYYRKIVLKKANVSDKNELQNICDKMFAYETTKEIYRENIHDINEKYRIVTSQVERIKNKISKALSEIGRNTDDESILEICDEVIEKNSEYYDLYDEIEADKAECERILSIGNTSGKKLSKEYSALQKELDFIQRQNDSLFKKKENDLIKIINLKNQLPDKDAILKKLAEIDEASKPSFERFDELTNGMKKFSADKDKFVEKVKEEILNEINSTVKFFDSDESCKYVFDENNKLAFNEKGVVIPLERYGNGIAEIGIILLRFIVANMMGYKKIPMIIDDIINDSTYGVYSSIIEKIKQSSSQLIHTTSLKKIYDEAEVGTNCLIM